MQEPLVNIPSSPGPLCPPSLHLAGFPLVMSTSLDVIVFYCCLRRLELGINFAQVFFKLKLSLNIRASLHIDGTPWVPAAHLGLGFQLEASLFLLSHTKGIKYSDSD